MATPFNLKKALGLDDEDPLKPWRNIILPESMREEVQNPFLGILRKSGDRADTPDAESPYLGGDSAVEVGDIPETVPLNQKRGPASLEDGLSLNEDTNIKAAAEGPVSTDQAAAAAQLGEEGQDIAEEEEGTGGKEPTFSENMSAALGGADLSPWAALVDAWTGKSKFAEAEAGHFKAKNSSSQLEAIRSREKQQQQRIDELRGRDYTRSLDKVTTSFLGVKEASGRIKAALTPVDGKVRLGQVYGVLNLLISQGGGKGTQTEGDIARVWSPFLDTWLGKLKQFIGSKGELVPAATVADLALQLENTVNSVSRIANEKVDYYKDHYVARDMSLGRAEKIANVSRGVLGKGIELFSEEDKKAFGLSEPAAGESAGVSKEISPAAAEFQKQLIKQLEEANKNKEDQ